jgi:crossover junction endodeoxyribonuclease RuvC
MSGLRLFIGVDPGLSGGVGLINERSNLMSVQDTPTILVKKSNGGNKNTYVVTQMVALLEAMKASGDIACAAIEYQASRPGQGAPATFSQGYGYGLWIGVLASLRIPYEIVMPQAWKKGMGIPPKSDKSASIIKALQLFPHAPLTTQRGRELDGRAEALLMAEHLRRKMVKA